MSKHKQYNTPPTGWRPAESSPGHIVHWDGPSVVVGPGLILVSTFRRKDGITVENIVDGAAIDPQGLLNLAGQLVSMYEEIQRAEEEINR